MSTVTTALGHELYTILQASIQKEKKEKNNNPNH